MAKQIAGLCFLEGTIDDLTFYKMDGQYYCRAKSSLTSQRVKTSPCFRLTMLSAGRMARASKIGAVIYQALPPRWRQFWMYRSFTGEAFTLLKHTSLTEEAITAQLHACYVAYWETRKALDPDSELWQPVPLKIRKRRKYSAESLQRRLDKLEASRPRAEQVAARKRLEAARKQAWIDTLAARDAARSAANQRRQRIAPQPMPWYIDSRGLLHPPDVPMVAHQRRMLQRTVSTPQDNHLLHTVTCNAT